ncbi:MAG: hypothetical protein H8E05_01185 [Bacteroidetes bacterium]|nr:hypothetical protein [Bacteroidota bacterium]
MPIKQISADGGTDSPREDTPWRAIPLKDTYLRSELGKADRDDDEVAETWQKQGILINPASCLMGGLDLTAKIPIHGLGLPFIVSEFDFVWLAVYFDANLRPIHAGIQKGSRFTRWYEYGGISMGGFPRNIKTVRRDHIGGDIGAQDPDGLVVPDIFGPEYDYVGHELEKEIEMLSPYGYLDLAGSTIANDGFQHHIDLDWGPVNGELDYKKANSLETLKKYLRSELTYFMQDPAQVKQWAAYSLLGYCTSSPPDKTYPYPHVELTKKITTGAGEEAELKYYYRQTAASHLMLQEINAGGVRANHIVPSFAPYIEALPHPKIESDTGREKITPSDGVKGTLPDSVVSHASYTGSEKKHGESHDAIDSPNVKSRIPLPGENAMPSKEAMGVVGAEYSNMWIKSTEYENKWTFVPAQAFGGPDGIYTWAAGIPPSETEFYMQKGGCMDSKTIKLRTSPVDEDTVQYVQEVGDPIDMWTR